MNITRDGGDLVVRIPLKQNQYNYYMGDDAVGVTDNLIGVCAGNEFTLSQLIDLSYKDDQQEGSPYIYFDTEEELVEICKKYDISIWKHPTCTFKGCGKVLRDVVTYGDSGTECAEHGYTDK